MPIFLQQHIEPQGEIGLWQIEESEEWFMERIDLHPNEQAQLDQIKGRKRTEWLAVRQLIHQMSGREKRGIFIKDEFGKPRLENSDWHISISHSRLLGAAIAAPQAVGIDIQKIVPKIERLIPKFMNKEEQASLSEQERIVHAHIYWGAKEALYKAYGRRELDFCTHILVEPFPFESFQGSTTGRIAKDGVLQHYTLYYQIFKNNYVLVYCLRFQP
ncbi:MAG: 4'-phosphopantetheinyl transferase superfamily protein [Bacteroidota bacterium]